MELYKIASIYLEHLNINHSKKHLKMLLVSHPDYPALISFTDTLEELNIKYSAIIADKSNLHELTFPLLGRIKIDEEQNFQIIKSVREFEDNHSLLQAWDGIALMVPSGEKVKNFTHLEEVQKDETFSTRTNLLVTILLITFLTPLILNFSLLPLFLLLTSILGVAVCIILLLKSMGKNIKIAEKLCSAGGDDGCKNVITNSPFKFSGDIGLSDIGLIYFFSISLFVLGVLLVGTQQDYSLLLIPFSISFILSFISIYYQWKIIKKWCRLCLIIISIVWFQALILFEMINSISLSFGNILGFAISLSFITASWLVIKSIISELENGKNSKTNILKFKRDQRIFKPFFESQRKIKNEIWDDDLVLGNRNAPINIIVACNPYCQPCAFTHKELEDIWSRYQEQICIVTRFAVSDENIYTDNPTPLRLILGAARITGKSESIIGEWFLHMDIDSFSKQYPYAKISTEEYIETAKKHSIWNKESQIRFTPTIFINGYEFPSPYDVKDISLLINHILENITQLDVVANTTEKCNSLNGFQKN
jgi:hypothetical protein